YPGGVHIDKAAKQDNENAYRLPHPKVTGSEYDFSFSGLKTAVINLVHNSEQKGIEINKTDLAASFQKTVTELLTEKTIAAAKFLGYKKIAVAGGVSANSGLRERMKNSCDENGFELFIPLMSLCGDNAAMIGCQGYYDFLAGKSAESDLNAIATLSLEKL
ncbi:MAG: tRNA (adenosine(37)-N6)-threonylcarbamoyltransferase complex transferase subunit TsaD, partial [Oscillospiraceae bacterium]